MRYLLLICTTFIFVGCSDPNSKPTYGESGLPKNCRALVQANIDMYKSLDKSHENYEEFLVELDGIMNSLERNCGTNGHAWQDN